MEAASAARRKPKDNASLTTPHSEGVAEEAAPLPPRVSQDFCVLRAPVAKTRMLSGSPSSNCSPCPGRHMAGPKDIVSLA